MDAAARLRAAELRARETDAVVAEARQHTEINRELSSSNHWMETIADLLLGGDPPPKPRGQS